MKDAIADANFPRTKDGCVYHLGLKPGQIANRVLTVGDHVRARRIAQLLDEPSSTFEYVSQRGFTTFTGRFKGVPVSIVAIGMGYPMMDFFVRETRAVVSGELIILRFGSCGTLVKDIPVGRVVVCSKALAITTNYDHFHTEEKDPSSNPYTISQPIPCDKSLHDNLVEELSKSSRKEVLGKIWGDCLHAAGDSFYSSQGRIDLNFMDQNSHLINSLLLKFPNLVTLEMETSHLFHLAAIASSNKQIQQTSSSNPKTEESLNTNKAKIRVAAVHMTFADRVTGNFISPERVEILEKEVGLACLETLVKEIIGSGFEHSEIGSVWELVKK